MGRFWEKKDCFSEQKKFVTNITFARAKNFFQKYILFFTYSQICRTRISAQIFSINKNCAYVCPRREMEERMEKERRDREMAAMQEAAKQDDDKWVLTKTRKSLTPLYLSLSLPFPRVALNPQLRKLDS